MATAVKISRTDHTAEELRGIAAKSRDGAQVRRLLALALILEGHSRHIAAERFGMDRQTLRDWVHRYNDKSMAGLLSIRTGGRQALLTPAQMAELKNLTIKGPDPETDRVVRWRCVDLCAEVARRFTVTVSEGTMRYYVATTTTGMFPVGTPVRYDYALQYPGSSPGSAGAAVEV